MSDKELVTINVVNNILTENDNIGEWQGAYITNKGAPVKYMVNYDDDNYIIFFYDGVTPPTDSSFLKMLLIKKNDGSFKENDDDESEEAKYIRVKLEERVTEERIKELYNNGQNSSQYKFKINQQGWDNFKERLRTTPAAVTTTAKPVPVTTTSRNTTTQSVTNNTKDRTIVIIIAVLIVLALGLGIFVYYRKKKNNINNVTASEASRKYASKFMTLFE
tara:strand:+ start:567 stop:1223 length:657 start_codon:yes stop_codon:yes gene_type:complete